MFTILLLATAISSNCADMRIRVADSIASSIDSIVRKMGENFKVYAEVEGKSKPVEVTDTLDWPEETEISYNIVMDSVGRIIQFDEIPSSESGDWYVSMTSFYDTAGRILKFEYYESFGMSECTKLLREYRTKYFDSNGIVYCSKRDFQDEHHKTVDTVGCYLFEPVDERHFKTTEDLKGHLGLKK